MGQKGHTIVLVQRENDLAVAVAFEFVSLGQQFGAVALMIVELPVHDPVDVIIHSVERLAAIGTEIDYRKSDVAETLILHISLLWSRFDHTKLTVTCGTLPTRRSGLIH